MIEDQGFGSGAWRCTPTVGIIRETQAADPARPLNKSTKRQRAMTRLKEDLGEQLTSPRVDRPRPASGLPWPFKPEIKPA
jgi:hypothetical protein